MLPTKGYFRSVSCPFHHDRTCKRSYCHFRHSRRDVQRLTDLSPLTNDTSEPLPSTSTSTNTVQDQASTSELVASTESYSVHDQAGSSEPVSSTESNSVQDQASTSEPLPSTESNSVHDQAEAQVEKMQSNNEKQTDNNPSSSVEATDKPISAPAAPPVYKPTPIYELHKNKREPHIPVTFNPDSEKIRRKTHVRKKPKLEYVPKSTGGKVPTGDYTPTPSTSAASKSANFYRSSKDPAKHTFVESMEVDQSPDILPPSSDIPLSDSSFDITATQEEKMELIVKNPRMMPKELGITQSSTSTFKSSTITSNSSTQEVDYEVNEESQENHSKIYDDDDEIDNLDAFIAKEIDLLGQILEADGITTSVIEETDSNRAEEFSDDDDAEGMQAEAQSSELGDEKDENEVMPETFKTDSLENSINNTKIVRESEMSLAKCDERNLEKTESKSKTTDDNKSKRSEHSSSKHRTSDKSHKHHSSSHRSSSSKSSERSHKSSSDKHSSHRSSSHKDDKSDKESRREQSNKESDKHTKHDKSNKHHKSDEHSRKHESAKDEKSDKHSKIDKSDKHSRKEVSTKDDKHAKTDKHSVQQESNKDEVSKNDKSDKHPRKEDSTKDQKSHKHSKNDKSDKSSVKDESTKYEKSHKHSRHDKSSKHDKSDKHSTNDKSDKHSTNDKSDKHSTNEKSDKHSMNDKSDKHSTNEKSDKHSRKDEESNKHSKNDKSSKDEKTHRHTKKDDSQVSREKSDKVDSSKESNSEKRPRSDSKDESHKKHGKHSHNDKISESSRKHSKRSENHKCINNNNNDEKGVENQEASIKRKRRSSDGHHSSSHHKKSKRDVHESKSRISQDSHMDSDHSSDIEEVIVPVETISLDSSSESDPDMDSGQEPEIPTVKTKVRTAHSAGTANGATYASVRSGAVSRSRHPKPPTPSQTLLDRFHKTSISPGPAPVPLSEQAAGPKVRIAHVPNVALLLNSKKEIISGLASRSTGPSTNNQPAASTTYASALKKNLDLLETPVIAYLPSCSVSVALRQNYIKKIHEEFLKRFSPVEAKEKTVAAESKIAESCKTACVYRNRVANLMMKIKNVSTQMPLDLDEDPLNPSYTYGVPLYDCFVKYTMTDLYNAGIPVEIPDDPGCARMKVLYRENRRSFNKERSICLNCGKPFSVDENNFSIERECRYHLDNKQRFRKVGGFREPFWGCCNQNDPCVTSEFHIRDVVNYERMTGFVKMPFCEDPEAFPGIYALDCEMCYTTEDCELTRVTVVNHERETVYDELCKPLAPIIDYCTRFSGVTEEDLQGVTKTLEDVQEDLMRIFNDRTILVGHGIGNDLKALKIIHTNIVDTSIVFPHERSDEFKKKLRDLAREFLKRTIQDGDSGHCSAEDALAALDLMIYKIKEDCKVYKPRNIISLDTFKK
ncbi:RNA exonuclease 1 homolog [Nilaparvata lugens]|uniref:RNA exonuclease 1 homolog n=1 Tax=Nilaparvata lugens TaxID=108931 RepID=UPI00193D3CA7|nr:RNA exonuclease 1 homolog [Nilaparvata lugens]